MSTLPPSNPPEATASFTAPLPPSSNFPLALAAGAGAAVVGALAWAAVTYATNYQIGFMAVGIGVLVGFVVRRVGRGDAPHFGYASAALALAGCLLGNVLTIYAIAAKELNISVTTAASQLDSATVLEVFQAGFSPIDLLFYGLAIYYGYKSAFARAG